MSDPQKYLIILACPDAHKMLVKKSGFLWIYLLLIFTLLANYIYFLRPTERTQIIWLLESVFEIQAFC